MAVGAAVLSGTLNYHYNGFWSWKFVLSLGLAVWIIYTFDHLLDAHKSEYEPTIGRHKFHRRNNKRIFGLLIIAAIVGFFSILYLSKNTIYFGLVLLGIVLCYFLLVFFIKKFYLKEVIVALVYTCGVFLGPLSMLERPISFEMLSHFAQILCLALLNLTLFSWFEYNLDMKDGHTSMATKFGKRQTKNFIRFLLIFLISAQLILMVVHSFSSFQSLLLVMSVLLFSLFIKPKTLGRNNLYRWVGDFIFFIPTFQLLF